MSPQYLIAEGPTPGRPSLIGKKIAVVSDGKEFVLHNPGQVIHEDSSGIILRTNLTEKVYPYPFNYQVLED